MGHTPGPWYVGKYGDNDSDVCAEDGPVICALRSGKADPYDMTADADAALIAAAPELLAMLRRGSDAVSALEADCDEHGIDCYPARHWWQDADRLIAKAEGRE
jgi:hypothetical protein